MWSITLTTTAVVFITVFLRPNKWRNQLVIIYVRYKFIYSDGVYFPISIQDYPLFLFLWDCLALSIDSRDVPSSALIEFWSFDETGRVTDFCLNNWVELNFGRVARIGAGALVVIPCLSAKSDFMRHNGSFKATIYKWRNITYFISIASKTRIFIGFSYTLANIFWRQRKN